MILGLVLLHDGLGPEVAAASEVVLVLVVLERVVRVLRVRVREVLSDALLLLQLLRLDTLQRGQLVLEHHVHVRVTLYLVQT